MALSMTSVRAPVFRSVALKPRTTARVSPAVFQRRSLVVRAEVRYFADVVHHATDRLHNNNKDARVKCHVATMPIIVMQHLGEHAQK